MTHTPHFFGYGSLVNRATHQYPAARRARLDGWVRAWCHTDARDGAYLTAVQAPGAAIDGLVAAVPGADWAALDLREAAYDRVGVTGDVAHDPPEAAAIAVYAVRGAELDAADKGPILLSYLDVVVQGFLREYGETGPEHFFETTRGWHIPVLNDRGDPRYPRHQRLGTAERTLIDALLKRHGVRVIEA